MASFEPFLRSSLKKYKHPDVAKADVLNAITTFSDLRPKYEDFVFSDGSTRMLLQLDGTIPVTYKGNVYYIPICICLLDTHPYSPPMVFVKPTSTMHIMSGQHVDRNGKIDLPYLREWKFPNSDLLGMVQILIIVFGKEPPVYSNSQPTGQLPSQFNIGRGYPFPSYPTIPTDMTASAYTSYSGMTTGSYPSCPLSSSSNTDQTTASDSSTIEDELQELQKLQELLKCKICKDRRVALTFLPCGHCIACEQCGSRVQNCRICPTGGANVRGTVKTIFVS